MFAKELTQSGHKARITITRGQAGWDVREERDEAVVRQKHCGDWHRVERAMRLFEQWQPGDLSAGPATEPAG